MQHGEQKADGQKKKAKTGTKDDVIVGHGVFKEGRCSVRTASCSSIPVFGSGDVALR